MLVVSSLHLCRTLKSPLKSNIGLTDEVMLSRSNHTFDYINRITFRVILRLVVASKIVKGENIFDPIFFHRLKIIKVEGPIMPAG